MEVTRVFEVLDYQQKNYPRKDALGGIIDCEWVTYSTEEFMRLANLVSYGLLAMGMKKGDKIITASNNRPEWNFLDMGMMQIGVVHVPIYPTLSNDETKYIMEHSEAKLAVVSDAKLFEKFHKLHPDVPNIDRIFTFNQVDDASNWREIADLGEKNEKKFKDELVKIKESIKSEDLFTIVYTSGTTGRSKGVMLSHQNVSSNLTDAVHLLSLDHSEKVLSFLPLCHIFERTVHYAYLLQGYGLYYAENLGTIGRDLKDLKVGGFVVVPRILEVMYDKIIAKGKALKGIKRTIFFWSVNLGFRYEHNRANGWFYEFKLKIANKLVFSKWREGLGGNVKMAITGSAAMQERLARVFTAAGIPIQEGYGLTETSPVLTANERDYPNNKFGSVGKTIKSVEIKIADDGEILAKGPNIMMGYFKDEAQTKAVIDKDGWFHTGDIGAFVDGDFLKITDRKKEIFKNSGGKYVAPQMIENKLKESFFIEQAMAIGEGQKFTSALIMPNFRFLHDYCAKKGIHYVNNEELVNKKVIMDRFNEEICEANKDLAPHEQVKRFRIVSQEWSPGTGEMSPTLKLKRKVIYEKHKDIIDEIFSMSS